MSSQSQRLVRMKRELELLEKDPPAGISAWPVDLDSPFTELRASMLGPQDSPFAGGVFQLAITVPERYPFEPPKVRFITPVYHPNIDSAGRICLDTLKMPPQGSWAPCINLSTMLTTVQLLLSNPNPDDALMADIVCIPIFYGRTVLLFFFLKSSLSNADVE